MSELLDVDEAAARLRCSRRRVFELIADGTLTRGPKYGRRTVITAESVAAALEPEPVLVLTANKPSKPRAPRSLQADLEALAAKQRAEWKKPRACRTSHP
ncbi:helix-turn-helix domain-containing protein [Archangium violaceum]|uniref:helix-turn-helix domain-containing protein n=1 Tax=Archangium violaceum TaxID=83451 RepID=UPI002B2C816E|nr:helix-turn-helix domain-containing protein [Archangium violaceum]